MTTLPAADELISEEEYLAGELLAETKHEYLGGVVYAMAGASEPHNIIAMNLYRELGSRLRGKPCQPFGSDMKVRLMSLGDVYYYYPDAMVACDPTDAGHGWRERPSVLFEILSREPRQVDLREKRLAYKQIASLEAYVRIEQDQPRVEIERRTDHRWKAETLHGLAALIRLPGIGLELPLAELYERLNFGAAQ